MSASNVRTSSTPAASSSLRPRTNRLISGLSDGGDPLNATSARRASPLPSPLGSRPQSPLPSSHLSRPRADNSEQNRSPGPTSVGDSINRQRRAGHESPSALVDLWGTSWSAIQGIASELMSGDVALDAKDKPTRTRRPVHRLQNGQRSSTSAPPQQWGPAAPVPTVAVSSVGTGTRDNQVTALRAKKRKDLLTQQESSYQDTLGKYKRRLSDERASISAPPGENEDREALVYIHHVAPDDTLAGITLKYNCSANVLRKANRMWPNDTAQARQILTLPVDACGVKGRPVGGSQALDLLNSDADALSAGQAEEVAVQTTEVANGSAFKRNRASSASTHTSRRPSSSAAASSVDTDQPWHHNSWVLLPGATIPTEIARLPRRALGYFPPARRKSNSYSDNETPSTSFDVPRLPASEQLVAVSPLRQDPPQRPQRPRRLSNANNGYFPSYLAGPGGVGTMGKDVRAPGPAQDGLNKMFAKHLPDVAPPRHHQALLTPGMPLYTDEPTPAGSGSVTPNHSRNLNLENVGGAIESWMRRVATQAKGAVQSTDRQRAARTSVGAPGRGAGGIGDLIEMTDEFEIGLDYEGEDEPGRGRQASIVPIETTTRPAISYFDGAVARERSKKGGKVD
ncbi:carbohydrate-binding module family 50 protein [Baudoinia panamericana UAMH 10762]|uniref:Carbohydrate-binding module family 50 protein n=1 Tax=Baudoinia panamericana (strain UAMH 10762) TaxID=717646 RepID=M2MP23_BAUPA|nr:carbohydrate-binding module family 50 protein [Baudoinia panamericana UAMH 10762]EMC93223.1 carbohydrate-binding module family 50 protein [Baudoinia panamericana UAMH 10762]